MATFYTGYRPVTRGRNFNNFVHIWKNRAGTYSNWDPMDNTSKLLAGMPNTEYVLGDRTKSGILQYLFAGKPHVAPMTNAGAGPRVDGARFQPLTYRGLATAAATYNAGHAYNRGVAYEFYSNFQFDGIATAEPLASATVGHALRYNQTYGGAFKPFVNQGVTPQGLASAGHNTDNFDPMVWKGVPSARVL